MLELFEVLLSGADLCGCFFDVGTGVSYLFDALFWVKGTDNRVARRSAKRSEAKPPARDLWSWSWLILTPIVIVITLLFLARLARRMR